MIISATDADSYYQVLGLRTTFMLISIIILIALGFSIWGLIIERSNVNASRDIKSRI
jgi:hypothetical protein